MSRYCLHYVVDPMCSWCWAFVPAFQALRDACVKRGDTDIRYVMGGLAADSDQPMPETMRERIQAVWRDIERRTGARFNHDFWLRNQPRRSTWPACRAAIAAGRLRDAALPDMVEAIQRAYYLEARNPSDIPILCDIAEEIGLDRERFAAVLDGEGVREAFAEDQDFVRRAGIQGFPAVVAEARFGAESRYLWVSAGYCTPAELLDRWDRVLADLDPAGAAVGPA